MMKREGNIEIPQACQRATHLKTPVWRNSTPTGLATLSGCATPVFSGVSDSLFSENIQYRIRNQKSGNEGVTAMLQCENSTMQEWFFALKGQVISAQGNALGWKGTRTPAPWFSASNPVANKGYKFQQGQVNPLQVQVATLQGRVNPLQGSRYFQQVHVATLQGSRYFQQARVATLQGSPYSQQGTVSAVPASVSDFLFLIAYCLFSENIQYRIRNHQSESEEVTTMQECHRAWSMEQGARGKEQAAGFGWRRPHTIVPLEKGGGDTGAGGFLICNSLFLISYFLFSENIQYRIRNNESGNEGMSYKLKATYPFPNYRDRQLQTRGRREACQRATHLTTLVNTPVKTTPTGLTTLSGWATLSGCSKNEIQFSKYPASGGTVIHGRRQ